MNGAWFEHALALALVNGLLWRAEDDLRGYRKARDPQGLEEEAERIIAVGFRIQDLNDRRAALVESINLLTGEHLGGEKVRG